MTIRSVLIGSIFAALICGLTPYNDYVAVNTFLVGSYFPLGMALLFFLLVVLVNPLILMVAPKRALRTPEMAVILTMTLVSCSIPSQGLLRALIPSMVASFYHGRSSQSFWNAFLGMDLPSWLFPVGSIADGRNSSIVTDFYGRVDPGSPIPYGPWIKPLLGWGVFVLGLWSTLLSMSWLLRVQWGQNERLPFPLAQVQLSLIEAPPKGRWLNNLFRSRGFWLAAGAVFLVQSNHALRLYHPKFFPDIPLQYNLNDLFSEAPLSYLPGGIKAARVYFTFVGVAFLIQARTAFSLWVFFLINGLVQLQQRHMMQYEIPTAAWRDQHIAACFVYLLGILWVGRHYWGQVIRAAFTFGPSADLTDLPAASRSHVALRGQYRAALLALVLGIVVMHGWLYVVGADWWMAVLIVGVMLLGHVITARIVAETGMHYVRVQPVVSALYMNLPATAVSMRDVYFGGIFTSNGPFQAREGLVGFATHGLRVADETHVLPRERGRMAAAIVWTLLLSFFVGTWSSLYCYYSYATVLSAREASNQALENYHGVDVQPRGDTVDPVARFYDLGGKKFPDRSHNPYVHFTIGATVTAFLQLAAWRFSGWPLLPVGYVVAGSVYITQAWFSIMIGWLAKVLIVRFGGAQLYQSARNVFIGLIFGEAIAAGVWLVITLIMASEGMDYLPIRFLPN